MLDRNELARQTGSTPRRIDQLVELGLLTPADAGGFEVADVQRVQIIAAYERGGIGLDDLAVAVRDGRVTSSTAIASTQRRAPHQVERSAI